MELLVVLVGLRSLNYGTNMNLKMIDKITCKCGFTIQKRIGCVINATVLWNLNEPTIKQASLPVIFNNRKTKLRFWTNYHWNEAPKLQTVFKGIVKFHCPSCNRVLDDTKRIRTAIKKFKMLSKLSESKVDNN
jgi:hypothetical protein